MTSAILPLFPLKISMNTAKSSSTCPVQTPDAQGRIFISQKLRDKAGITGDVTVIGNYNRAEIWASDRLEASKTEVDEAEIKALLATISL